MAIFTALAKILSLKNYYSTKITGLGKHFIPEKFSAVWYSLCCVLFVRSPSSGETLSSWFTERATEIEELSGQVHTSQ